MYNNLLRLIKGRDIQLKAVISTALASYVLQLSAILLHWHLWAIALATLIPWIPLFTMKVLYNSRHYGFMAFYMVLMLVQVGHVGEHVVQMGEYMAYREHFYTGQFQINQNSNARMVVLNAANHQNIAPLTTGTKLIEAINLNPPQSDVFVDPVTNKAVVYPNCGGWTWNGPGCPSAHGVFGELDRELIHFLWDGAILIACAVLFFRFRDNPWTKWGLLAAFIHQIEHIFLYGASLVPSGYPGAGTFLGLYAKQLDAGLMAHNGVLASAIPFYNDISPNRINIHFIYNVLVMIPMILSFAYEVKRIYDEWLAKALPNLSRDQLIYFSQAATPSKFEANQIIFNQGDAADRFYIITQGQVQILRADKRGFQKPVATLSEGAYFGEIGILGRTRRTATVKTITPVEVLSLDENTFRSMIAASGESYKDVDIIVKRRIKQLGAVQGKNIDRKIDADPDLLVKSRVIQGWLDDMEYKSQLLNWNGLAEPVAPQGGNVNRNGTPGPVTPSFPNAQAAVTVLPPPSHNPQYTGGSNPTVQSPVPGAVAYPPAPAPGIAVQGNGYNGPPPGGVIGSLKVRSGNSTGQRFEINAPRVVIGRRSNKPSSNGPLYMVDDNRVSREHIEIVRQPDGVYLRDLGSSNGTWLNGTQLEGTPVRLDDGAEIRLGTDTVLTYRYGQ
ncbi:MAG: Cyclic nucleotide-binding domain (cNMP-BD) protein [Chloroflexi bacterium]|nr:Cyclic nucleotide-binding domain (cNMP-BD) protein [Chloroflexota bacterium]